MSPLATMATFPWVLLTSALCLSNTSCAVDEPTSSEQGEVASLQHAQDLVAQSLVVFSHDHVRNQDPSAPNKAPNVQLKRSIHFSDARAGGVTAMTLELYVDNITWQNNGTEVWGPVGTGGGQSAPPAGSGWSQSQAEIYFTSGRDAVNEMISDSGGTLRLVRTVEDIDQAKVNGQLGIIYGIEGAVMLGNSMESPTDAQVWARIQARYLDGWRKGMLFRSKRTAFVTTDGGYDGNAVSITDLGRKLVSMFNKRGVIVDVMHLNQAALTQVFPVTNAPLQVSHNWMACDTSMFDVATLNRVVASGGGHGVISVNALANNYFNCGLSPTVAGLAATLADMRILYGIDHIALGPDYQPEGGGGPANGPPPPNLGYTLPGTEGTAANPNPIPVADLIYALQSAPYYFTDEDVKKAIGANLRDLYQRIWDPTHNYDGGPAHFRLCSNWASDSTNPNKDLKCAAAASNEGQGDLRHRAINCGHNVLLTPTGAQLSYRFGQWMFKNLNNDWLPCSTDPRALTLVVSWGDFESKNGNIALYGTPTCGASCQAANSQGGIGTANARALNCINPGSPGTVGIQLAYSSPNWYLYNLNAQPVQCSPNTTLVANWGSGITNGNARVRLCDDFNNHAACAAAATNAGSGTAQAKALGCLSSTARMYNGQWEHGTQALQVFYSTQDLENPDPNHRTDILPEGGHWRYWDVDFTTHRCVHGSVLVATTLP